MKNYFNLISLCFILIVFFSCDIFLEENIIDYKIVLNSPADQVTINELDVIFWWEEMEGVEKYNLQVVKPGFDFVENLVADTFVSKNKLELKLSQGSYQWRVSGHNGYYDSDFSVGSFTVDTTAVALK